MSNFKEITITKWQQFDRVFIPFHSRMTIITGANGSGKTTILKNILAKHLGWSSANLATPRKNITTKALEWISGLMDSKSDKIGEIVYEDQTVGTIHAPDTNSAQYTITIDDIKSVEGFFMPSHRTPFNYQQIDNLSLRHTFDKEEAFNKVSESLKNRYNGGQDVSSSYHIKQILISWNILGHGNPDMPKKEELLKNFLDFEKVLKIVLPRNLRFQRIEIRDLEIVFCCEGNEFLLDGASGGISTIIDLAWQIHMYSTDKRKGFVVIIDEAENHLHPTMQRTLLPDMLKAFPQASFIVSTHSPLIVSSVKESTVVALRDNKGKIYSETLDLLKRPRTATEVLDEVLGVSFTMPIWAEEELSAITKSYLDNANITEDDLKKMREELKLIGLERLMPEAIYKIADKKHD